MQTASSSLGGVCRAVCIAAMVCLASVHRHKASQVGPGRLGAGLQMLLWRGDTAAARWVGLARVQEQKRLGG
jgi:hypothetical protein